ncbi:MAG: DUF1559 family PulG-like putative transporter, partial [Planctomycetota bacterium]
MVAASGKQGFTWIELLVVILIIAIFIIVLIPTIQFAREAQRRARCINNMKQLGVALDNHHNASKKFPASCTLPGPPVNQVQNGWSWLTFTLPFGPCNTLYDDLQVKKNP